jgi:CDP-diacylglycerol---serine O-phosphatidyltransferase
MKPLRAVSVLPTMFTLGNLVCGFFAIVVASRIGRPEGEMLDAKDLADLSNLVLSGSLIFIAMVFDALDGHVARLSHTSSDFGAQLDSLCDAVSFGVAPGFLLVKMCPMFAYGHREAVWIIAAGFASCAVLRLARFNVETSDDDDHMHFSGLPSPAAAGSIAGFAVIFHTLMAPTLTDQPTGIPYAPQIYAVLQTLLPFYAIVVALLMVSRIPYPHVVNQVFRGQRSLSHVVKVVFGLMAIMIIRGFAVPIIFCVFALSSPVRYLWERVFHHRHQDEAIF